VTVGLRRGAMFVIGSEVLTGLQDRETLEAVIEDELKGQENSTPQ
jgi:hypothetical protein